MLRALPALSTDHREALLLVSADGLSPSAAARMLGIKPAAFRMRLTAARRSLRRAVENGSGSTSPSHSRSELNEVTL